MSSVVRIEICIDCADPEDLIPFWMAALGYVRDRRDARGLVDPDGAGPPLWFQRVPEPKTVKNRLHIDAYFDDEAGAERRRDELVALGATAVGRFEDFWLMNDPAGNEFCLCWPI